MRSSHDDLCTEMAVAPAFRRVDGPAPARQSFAAMRVPLLVGVILTSALGACASARSGVPLAPLAPIQEEPLTPESSTIGLRKSVVADQYFWLRAKALEGEAPAPFAEALAAMRDLRADLAPDPTAWEDLEVPLGAVQRASELAKIYQALPASRDVGGRPVQLRDHAVKLAHAMAASEDAFRRGPFREHSDDIARAAKDLSGTLLPKVEEILHAVEVDMALPGIQRSIMVTLVADAPYPGIFAADARGHATASFVRVRGLEGGALVETVLHESLHAIDELTVRSPTAMNMLRGALQERGIDAKNPNVEMAVNTVTFAEAASLVRRFIDPAHKPLGESGFYVLYPPARAIVAAWDRHVAGESLDATADAIARAVAQPDDAP